MKRIPDKLWCEIEKIIPKKKTVVGRPEFDNKKTFEGILFVLRTGIQWCELPAMYGHFSTRQLAISWNSKKNLLLGQPKKFFLNLSHVNLFLHCHSRARKQKREGQMDSYVSLKDFDSASILFKFFN